MVSSSTGTSNPANGSLRLEARRRHGWLWWSAYTVLLLAALALLAFLLVRRPEIIYRTVPGPGPDPEQVERLDNSRARADELRNEMSGLQAELAKDECPAGLIKDPNVPPIKLSPGDSGSIGAYDSQLASTFAERSHRDWGRWRDDGKI
jgi:hypothetical protein